MKAAQVLEAAGYTHLASVEGGTRAGSPKGLPVTTPDIDTDFYDRYSRHLRLPEVGEAGQRRLEAARVAMVGAGGLGSPAAYYLAAAGVGTLVLADDDVVDRSNLQRQILHTDARIGVAKVESARIALSALNPRLRIESLPERITAANVERLIGDADVVIDGADNFPVRYLLNDACVKLGKPLVYGAVHRFEGQVSVYDAGRHRGVVPCYRCLFPEPPPPEAAPNCAEAGVLGVLPGVIGLLQATEAIKLILGIGESLAGRLLSFDALSMRFRETRLRPDQIAWCARRDVNSPDTSIMRGSALDPEESDDGRSKRTEGKVQDRSFHRGNCPPHHRADLHRPDCFGTAPGVDCCRSDDCNHSGSGRRQSGSDQCSGLADLQPHPADTAFVRRAHRAGGMCREFAVVWALHRSARGGWPASRCPSPNACDSGTAARRHGSASPNTGKAVGCLRRCRTSPAPPTAAMAVAGTCRQHPAAPS